MQRVLAQCLIVGAKSRMEIESPTENGARVGSALSVTHAKPGSRATD